MIFYSVSSLKTRHRWNIFDTLDKIYLRTWFQKAVFLADFSHALVGTKTVSWKTKQLRSRILQFSLPRQSIPYSTQCKKWWGSFRYREMLFKTFYFLTLTSRNNYDSKIDIKISMKRFLFLFMIHTFHTVPRFFYKASLMHSPKSVSSAKRLNIRVIYFPDTLLILEHRCMI